MTDFVTNVEITKTNNTQDKKNGEIPRTSSFQSTIDQSVRPTPTPHGDNDNDDILGRQSKNSPRRGRRAFSPMKSYSPTRNRSTSNSPRRERSFLRSTSPDKLPFRRSTIWAQWEVTKNKGQECLQEYNIKQMTNLYGKELGGKVDAASDWYRENGLNRSKTQMEALEWLSEEAVQSASAPVSCTPRGTQTESATPSELEYKKFVGSPYKNKEMRAREMLKEEKNLNKLSHRHRVQRTPNVQDIRAREEKFTNDAIVTERRRTRFKDIIPQYDASSDRHCKAYFKRRDVQRLLDVTCSREENEWLEEYLERKRQIYQKYSLFSDNNKSDKENNSEDANIN
ncbi:hypothetical protein ACF0H5_012421 [Mactra antiquata]